MVSTVSTRLFALALLFLFCSSSLLQAQGGYTLDFDGTDDYIDCGYLPFSSNMTYEAWIKTTDSKSRSDILSWGNTSTSDVVAEFRTSLGKLEFGINDGGWVSLISNTSINDGEWHHVAASKNGSTITLYVDGVLDNTGTVGGTPSVNQTDIGVLYNGGTREPDSHFTGDLDEIRVWSDVRTQAEIQANMHKELAGSEGNLLAYYQMSDGLGTSLTDNSTNSYTGTITNAPAWKTSGAHAGPRMALDFDGSNDYFFAPLNATATSSITVEGWFSFNSLTNQQNLMNIHRTTNNLIRFVPYKTAANEVALFVYDGSGTYVVTSTFTISQTDVWHHLVFIYDAGTISIYANGSLVGSATGQGSFSTAATNLFSVGADYNGVDAGLYANIKADEIRIWSDVRSQAEILAYKDRTLDGDEANLLSYYRCDQQAVIGHTNVYDYGANGHNGSLTNMDATTDWVTSAPFNTWIGSEDSDWGNADNWSNGAVPSGEDVSVFAWNAATNTPSSGSISARNFYVDAAASISHSGDLTLSDYFTNEGTFETSGRVTFSGSTAQTIKGGGSTSFGSWTVNNAAGVTLESALTVTSSITLSTGVVDLNSQTLTINSAASLSGVPGNSNHVDATSGALRKIYSGTGSFTFPVGDGTNYTPISLNFTSGTFSSAYTDISLSTVKHSSNASTSHFLRRYWTVNGSGISDFSCDVSATYVIGDINGTESELYGGKWSSGWVLLDPVNTSTHQITGTVSGFSDFTAGEAAAFPVEWLSFEAESASKGVDLSWATASESNSHYFGVERSSDLGTWTEIGQVDAAGFSTEENQYLFTDLLPTSGENFYRLRQVDFDGRMDYSEVRSVWMNESLKLYPNPVRETLNLDLPAGDWQARMFDQQGREVRSISQVGSTIDMEKMPAGVYYLILENGQGQRMSERVVRQ